MKRVVHLSSVHQPFDVRIFEKQARSVAAAGYSTVIVVPHLRDEERDGVTVRHVKKPTSRLRRMLLTALAVTRRGLEERGDLYHFHDPELLPAGVLLKLLGKKVIYDSHEHTANAIMSKHYIAKWLRVMVSSVFAAFERACARRFDYVIAATPSIRDYFRALGCRAIDVNNYPLLTDYPPVLAWGNKERAVCYVGGIASIRGAKEMVEAIGRTDVKLLIAGNYSPPSLRDELVRLPGWENVEELGHLDRAGVTATMGRSVAGLVLFHPEPNHVEAQPNKIFEYMAAGLPVIGSDFPRWRELIEQREIGHCVNPLDTNALAQAILLLADNTDQARELGTRGRIAVEQEYHWESQSKKLLAVYATVLGS